MRLKIKNFKQYENHTADLPSKGLVLLKGLSGAGKSTILNAIYRALVGGLTEAKPWSGGAPTVNLDMYLPETINIIRTGTPNTLNVKTKNGYFQEDAAQAEIERVLGMNEEEILASSYIKQGMSGSLLKLGPADQLRLIQKLAFGAEDPEIFKKSIAQKISTKQKDFDLINSLVKEFEEQSLQKLDKRNFEASKLIEPKIQYSQVEIENFKAEMQGLVKKEQEVQSILTDLSKRLANPMYDSGEKLKNNIDILTNQLDELTRTVAKDLETLATTADPYKDTAKDQLQAFISAIDSKADFFTYMEQAVTLTAKIKEAHPGLTGPIIPFLEDLITKTEDKLAAATSQITRSQFVLKEIEALGKGQECPQCKVLLATNGGKIELHAHQNPNEIADKKKEAEDLIDYAKNDFNSRKQKIDDTKPLLDKAKILKALLQKDPAPQFKTKEEATKAKLEYLKIIKEFDEIVSKRTTLKNSIDSMNRDTAGKQDKVRKLLLELEHASKLMPKAELLGYQITSAKNLESVKVNIKRLEPIISEITLYEGKKLQYGHELKYIRKLDDEYAELKAKHIKKLNETTALNESLASWERLKALSDFAAVGAVEAIISDINHNAQVYIDQMFSDDGTVVRLLNSSKTKKGDDKAKLSLDIVHKGQEVGKKFDDLSGGEQDRVILAFQLAMSDMYSSPFLFVDEGFKGADVEKTLNAGLEVLKEISQHKLVVVVQHGAPEHFFDEIVQL